MRFELDVEFRVHKKFHGQEAPKMETEKTLSCAARFFAATGDPSLRA
jgi:hypothetical protein